MTDSTASSAPAICPECGAQLPAATGGLCPHCLMADAAQPTRGPSTSAAAELPTLEEVAAAFPQIEIIEFIGAGGMGSVWRARQPKLNRHVALKLLPESLAERDPAFAERFEREGQLLARLHHPNIVTVHDSGRAGKFFYLLMEFVDGVNLRQAMRASRFTSQQALAIVPKICDALQYAHEEGVLHRDIKPENILLDSRGRVKLVDFGIAKLINQAEPLSAVGSLPGESLPSDGLLTLGDTTLGTPQYMAPEQIAQPADVDHRADIYSLGVVFYELLTGELPLGKFSLPSEKSASDPRLDGIVQQALEKERGRRQQSVSEMRTQMETISQSPPPVVSTPPKAQPSGSRVRFLILLGFDVFLGALLVLTGWAANSLGAFFNAVAMFLLLMVPLRIVVILWNTFHGSLKFGFWRKPGDFLRYGGQVANGWLFWLMAALVLEMCIVPAQFPPKEYSVIHVTYWVLAALLMLLELLPSRRILVATNLAFAVGWIFIASQFAIIFGPVSKADGVVMAAPFVGEWLVVQGGNSSLINIHHGLQSQRDALDIEKTVDGLERTGDRGDLESYPSWGQPLYAPVDGKIVTVVSDLNDNPVGQMDARHLAGNHVVISMGKGSLGRERYVLMAHLQKGSVLAKPGDTVRAGQPLAKCGNSGNTSHPHLHLEVMDRPNLLADGTWTFPVLFRDVTCLRRGHPLGDPPFFVRRNDRIVSEKVTLAAEKLGPDKTTPARSPGP